MPIDSQMQGRANSSGLNILREENNNLASSQGTWYQDSSPFNTPPPTGDSVESLSDLLNMPTARTGDHLPHLYQLRSCVEPTMPGCQNVDFLPWSQNSSPFDNTPPPHGDSISDLLCLNMPRGTLIGNSSPLAAQYNVTHPIDANAYQGAGIRYGNYQQMRYEPSAISLPRKVGRPMDNAYGMAPICPPANSPPIKSTRSSPGSMTSNSNSVTDSNSNTSLGELNNVNYNANGTLAVPPSQVVCPANEQEWTNIQNLYSLQRQQQDCDPQLMNKIIERTGRLLLAAVQNDQVKCPDSYDVYNNGQGDKQTRFPRNLNGNTIREVSCTWVGELPTKNYKQPVTYSCKVFVGGMPWDISEVALIQAFSRFGSVKVEWPKKDGTKEKKGFAYLILESEKKVRQLLECCTYNYVKTGDFYKIQSRKMKSKETQVQIIPWVVSDSNYAKVSQKLDPHKTVFVGALHGMIHAEALAKIMSDLFGAVVYAGLDTDKYKYPIGSGRVTFVSHNSYMKAVLAAFIEVKTSKFSKKVQINPYLEDSPCSACSVQQGPYFCREITCFRYFCRGCWKWQHSSESMRSHQELTRGSKNKSLAGTVCSPHSAVVWE